MLKVDKMDDNSSIFELLLCLVDFFDKLAEVDKPSGE